MVWCGAVWCGVVRCGSDGVVHIQLMVHVVFTEYQITSPQFQVLQCTVSVCLLSSSLSHALPQTSTHAWHVHQRRIGPNGECGSVFAGGHYNPFAVSLTTESGYPTDCNDLNQHRCEMGDLSGKHGRLTLEPSTAEPRRTVSYFDETLDLWGPYTGTVADRGVV